MKERWTKEQAKAWYDGLAWLRGCNFIGSDCCSRIDMWQSHGREGHMETAKREITEVSGGQLQRACLCRSLINNPKMIFADEPTGALNQKASMEVISELVKANREGTSVMMVTHSEKVASCSERVIFLVDGNIEGELKLGKMQSEDEIPVRERKLRNWLQERDW